MPINFESLEFRRLFSAVTDADQAAVDAANKQWSQDKTAQSAILNTDQSKLSTDKQTLLNIISPLLTQLKDDGQNRLNAIQKDKAAGLAAKQTILATISGDRTQISKDKSDAEALLKDKAKLLTDKSTLKTTLFNTAKSIADDNLKYVNVVKSDRDAIVNAKLTDSATNADRVKLLKDTAAAAKILATDVKTLAKAKYQLYKDELEGN